MPNWCSTQYVLVSEYKEQLDELHSIMEEFESMKRESLPNGFGNTWLGNLVDALGADWQKVYCRGSWSNLNHGINTYGEHFLSFDTEHAWSRPDEVEELIREKFPEIDIYFFEEEPGMCILQTNDSDGKYFPEEYLLDIWDDSYEYCTLEDALKRLSEYLNRDFKTYDEASESVSEYNEKAEAEGSENYINFRKVDIV